MKNINFFRVVGIPVIILLIPFLASLITSEMNWDPFDYIVAFVLMSGSSFLYDVLSKKGSKKIFRSGVMVLIATSFLLTWVNLAVGLIGNEENPANLLYFGVLAIGVVGAIVSQVEPLAMQRTLYLMAVAQFLVPLIAMNIWNPPVNSGLIKVLILNFFFVMMWVVSALLFKRASQIQNEDSTQ